MKEKRESGREREGQREREHERERESEGEMKIEEGDLVMRAGRGGVLAVRGDGGGRHQSQPRDLHLPHLRVPPRRPLGITHPASIY